MAATTTYRAIWTVWDTSGRVTGTAECDHPHPTRDDAERCPDMVAARTASDTNDWTVEPRPQRAAAE